MRIGSVVRAVRGCSPRTVEMATLASRELGVPLSVVPPEARSLLPPTTTAPFELHVDDAVGRAESASSLGVVQSERRTRLLLVDQSSTGRLAPLDIAWDSAVRSSRLRSMLSRTPLLLKAVGWRERRRGLRVIDCTGGWAMDALALASYGCGVRIVESDVTVAALLRICRHLATAGQQPVLREPALAERIGVIEGDAVDVLSSLGATACDDWPEVIYLDPLFVRDNLDDTPNSASVASSNSSSSKSSSSAAPSRWSTTLSALTSVTPSSASTVALASAALRLGDTCRIVAKVPATWQWTGLDRAPSFRVPGRAVRFDVWLPLRPPPPPPSPSQQKHNDGL